MRPIASAGLAGATVFLLALVDILLGGPASRSDASAAQAALALGRGVLRPILAGATWLGEWHATWLVVAFVAARLAVVRRAPEAWVVVLAVAAVEATTLVAKLAMARERPTDALVATLGYAFPSGHASRAAAVATVSAWLAARHRPVSAALLAVAAAWVVLVMISRVALGAHWATDVVGGAGLGVAVVAGVVVSVEASGRLPRSARDPA